MDFFDKNLAVIHKSQPNLAARLRVAALSPLAVAQPSRQGPLSLSVGQNRLTSSVDPVNEGLSLAAAVPSGPVVALGFGLGYHLEPLAGRCQLIIWEPDIELLRFSLSARDCSAWLKSCVLAVEKEELGQLNGHWLFIPRAMQRLYPLLAMALERMLKQAPETRVPRSARPRVLVIPPLLGGSLDPAYWCVQALNGLGCETRIIPMESMAVLYRRIRACALTEERQGRAQAPLMRFLGELALLEAEEFAPDLVLALAQAPLDRRAIKELKASGAKVGFWFVEDFRQMRYFVDVAASYDFFFYIQGQEMAENLESLGANHHYLPVAAHPSCHRPLGLSPEQQAAIGAPVGFMGAGYPNRVRILSRLVEKGLPLKIWGVDWPTDGPIGSALRENRYITSQEIVEIYNSCPIVLNLHSSPHSRLPIGGVDFVNPRTFEVPACNAFQLVDNVPGLKEFFVPDTELAVFSSEDELMEKVRYYLERPGQRQTMAAAARRKVLNNHTYYHRMEKLLDVCLGPLPRPADGIWAEPVACLLNHAG